MTEIEKSDAGVSRRTILKAAAWSTPVVALAVAAPAAAASADDVEIAFLVLFAELRREDVFAGFVTITNTTGADIVDETATLALSGFLTDEGAEAPVSVTAPSVDGVHEGENGNTGYQNSAFPSQVVGGDTAVFDSPSFSLARGASITFVFYLERRAFNPVQKVLIIAGYIRIGTRTVSIAESDQLEITLPDGPD